MDRDELETGARELAEIVQEQLVAIACGDKTGETESLEKLRIVLELLKDSCAHFSLRKERVFFRPDNTPIGSVETPLTDYCFVSNCPDDSAPCYCVTIIISVLIKEPDHAGPGGYKIIIDPYEEDDDDEDTPEEPSPLVEHEYLSSQEETRKILRDAGLLPPPKKGKQS